MALKTIDWDRINEHETAVWLKEAQSHDHDVQLAAIGSLHRYLAPSEKFERYYSSSAELLQLVRRDVVYLAVPFLVELLKHERLQKPEYVLDILHDMAWYCYLEDRIPEDNQSEYQFHARRIFNTVYLGIGVYEIFLDNENRLVRETASALLEKLNRSERTS